MLTLLCKTIPAVCLLVLPTTLVSAGDNWYVRKSEWHGFDRFHFEVAERACYVVVPEKAAAGNPWIWRARFPNFHFEMDVELLRRGFHVAYVEVGGLFGSPKAVKIGDQFYEYMTTQRGLSKRPALEGVSRGGLFVYNWVFQNPTRVSCIYCDTPVLDLKSWPGGRGTGIGAAGEWKRCLAEYQMSEEEALKFQGNPLDRAAPVIAEHAIPVLHIVSENDEVVPPSENTRLLQAQLQKLGHPLSVISVPEGTPQSHGHHFEHPDPHRVVSFLLQHASGKQ